MAHEKIECGWKSFDSDGGLVGSDVIHSIITPCLEAGRWEKQSYDSFLRFDGKLVLAYRNVLGI